jgi:signal transduction histidine kinase
MEVENSITYAQLKTLYEVSKKINSHLNLQRLLDEIMDLAIELLHAEKGLILFRDQETGELSVQVARAMDKRTIQDVVAMSHSIIKKVGDECQSVFLQNIPDIQGKETSRSITRYKIKSVICVPLRARDRLIGAIYLDTVDSKHFFRKEDLFFVEAFANLAVIAIENAKSYEEVENLNANLEKTVEQRTQELKQKHKKLMNAYQELKTAELQLIRSEKMASLGMLVAGVAHEINTPLGSINSNNDLFLRSFEKFQQGLSFLLQSGAIQVQWDVGTGLKPAPIEEITKTLEVLERLSRVNKIACERIIQIVKALRNFARLDEGEFKTVDIHEGLDSTLALLRHQYDGRIEIIKEYGEIPLLRCQPSQLNQVFMNLLLNACQAIEGDGKILIRTYFDENQVCVQIQDTGVGIPSENVRKIFDPGFTTKGNGVGMGLGLSITYKIVEDHGGTMSVESTVGRGTTFTVRLPHRV